MVMKNVKKQIRKIPYLCFCMLFGCLTATAQNTGGKTVKGVILDSNGETVIGASVVVKGNSSIGTISDIDGNFTLKVPDNAVLVISFVGMKPQEVKVTDGGLLRVTLEDNSQQFSRTHRQQPSTV